jgi:hypothetical protein
MDSLAEYGACTLSLIPGRKEPKESSEMVSQLIFGEAYEVLDKTEKWVLIKNGLDNYEFWIDRKMHQTCSFEDYARLIKTDSVLTAKVAFAKNTDSGESTLLSMGSRLNELKDSSFQLLDAKYQIEKMETEASGIGIEELAMKFLNSPYLWGGKSVFGVDCSGYVQIILSCCGVNLPRDAYQQAECGEQIAFTNLIQAGDLVFFDNAEGRITHVGIALDPQTIIHASGKVRIDKLDHEGIYNQELKTYTHKTRLIRRVLNLE